MTVTPAGHHRHHATRNPWPALLVTLRPLAALTASALLALTLAVAVPAIASVRTLGEALPTTSAGASP